MSSSRKVILTGASGLIGKEAIMPLVQNNFEIYALTSQKKSEKDENTPFVHWIECNIFDSQNLKAILSNIKASHLLHFAWCSTGDYLTSDINYRYKEASFHLLKTFIENGGKKAVFAGTCFEYEHKTRPLTETDTLNPTNLYAKCKVALYEEAMVYCQEKNVDFGWGRIFYVYGRKEHEKRLTAHLINNLLNEKEVTISYASLVKDYMYSKDIAQAFVKFLNSNVTGAVNICSGKEITLGNYAKTLAQILNKENFLIIKDEKTEQAPYIVGDTARLLHEISYNMQYDLEKGLKDLLKEDLKMFF